MLVFDFFAGTGSSTQAFKDAGHTVISFELDDYFEATTSTPLRSIAKSKPPTPANKDTPVNLLIACLQYFK